MPLAASFTCDEHATPLPSRQLHHTDACSARSCTGRQATQQACCSLQSMVRSSESCVIRQADPDNGVQVADTLHRMVEQLAWAEAEAARRQPVLDAIAQLDQARTECTWLAAYEADPDRYKVPACHQAAWTQAEFTRDESVARVIHVLPGCLHSCSPGAAAGTSGMSSFQGAFSRMAQGRPSAQPWAHEAPACSEASLQMCCVLCCQAAWGMHQGRSSAAAVVSVCAGRCLDTVAAVQGRDSTRNLNRSIKAKKLQERLLPSVQDLCAQLQAWAQDSGRPFILDNQDFLVPPPAHVQQLQCSASVGMTEPRVGEQAAARWVNSSRAELESPNLWACMPAVNLCLEGTAVSLLHVSMWWLPERM